MSKIIYKGISYGSNGSESDTPHVALTQAEYDALSQSEKENGTIYFITDATSNILPNYTNIPIVVGKLNGQIIYRKVFTGNTPSTSGSVIFTDECLNTFINMSGYVLNTGNSRLTLPAYYVSSSDYMVMYPQGDSMKFVMGNSSVLGNRPYVCIVDYLAQDN